MAEDKENTQEQRQKEQEKPREILMPDFSHLVQTFAAQALMNLGKIINPITNKYETDLNMAKYSITVMEILEEKTRGNLDANEEKLLKELLHQVRMAYLDESKKAKQAKS